MKGVATITAKLNIYGVLGRTLIRYITQEAARTAVPDRQTDSLPLPSAVGGGKGQEERRGSD